MEFNWNADTIRWYQTANQYTGFFKNIAAMIAPRLKGYATLGDLGCGLGLIDLELSAYIPKITCVDINPTVLAALEKSSREKGIANIETRLTDCTELEKSWDVIYVSFFGSRHLEEFRSRCKKLFAIVNGTSEAELYPAKYTKFHKFTVDQTILYLEQEKIPYSLTQTSLEFGQPFVSLEDARYFLTSHSPQSGPEELTEFLHKRLTETGEDQYPYYIPRRKAIGIFEIEGYL